MSGLAMFTSRGRICFQLPGRGHIAIFLEKLSRNFGQKQQVPETQKERPSSVVLLEREQLFLCVPKGAIIPTESQASTQPNFNLFYPDELYRLHLHDFLKPCPTTKA